MGKQMESNPPLFTGSSFKTWQQKFETWQSKRKIHGKVDNVGSGISLLRALDNTVKHKVKKVLDEDGGELESMDRMEIMEVLGRIYNSENLDSDANNLDVVDENGGYEAWGEVKRCVRADGMTLQDYVLAFKRTMRKADEKAINRLSEEVLGYIMLDGAKVGELESIAVLASCGDKPSWKKVAGCLIRLHKKGYLAETGPGAAALPAERPDCIPGGEWWLLSSLFVVAFAVRLWNIHLPDSVVFDELHFGRFVKRYRDGSYFFDIHPPLAKLILAAVSYLFCNDPTLDYEDVAVPYGETDYVALRVTSALFGAGVVPVIYAICREMGMAVPAAIVPAIMQLFDSLVIIESRLILLDAQLVFFIGVCLLCALKLWGARKKSRARWMYLIATALFGAAAFSVKWTAAPTSLLVALVSASGLIFPCQGKLDFIEIAVAGAIAISFYLSTFAIHFKLLPRTGDGDAFMLVPFQKTLIGNEYYDADAAHPWFLRSFWWLNLEMFRANQRINTPHPYESNWYSWIVSRRGLLYHYSDKFGKDLSARIYLIVNPAVTFATLTGLIALFIITFALYLPKRLSTYRGASANVRSYVARGIFFLLGYALNLLPYIAVSRCTFLYHYIPSLFYGELAVANLLNILPSRMRWLTSTVLMVFVFSAYVFWSPWIYGTPLSAWDQADRRLYGASWE